MNLNKIAEVLNDKRIGLFITFESNDVEDIFYFSMKEGTFDFELDQEIKHLAYYDSLSAGGLKAWVCRDASRKMQFLLNGLKRWYERKQRLISNAKVIEVS